MLMAGHGSGTDSSRRRPPGGFLTRAAWYARWAAFLEGKGKGKDGGKGGEKGGDKGADGKGLAMRVTCCPCPFPGCGKLCQLHPGPHANCSHGSDEGPMMVHEWDSPRVSGHSSRSRGCLKGGVAKGGDKGDRGGKGGATGGGKGGDKGGDRGSDFRPHPYYN